MQEVIEEIDREDVWPKRTLREYAGIYARGLAMGAADIVPGVSGGTIAFISGIYEELVSSIRAFGRPRLIRAALHLRIQEVFKLANWRFLMFLGVGIMTAIFALAGFLEYMLVNRPVFLWAFFFGLVLASVFTISRSIKIWRPQLLAATAAGAIGAFWLVGIVPMQTPETWWFFLLSGALASCAMILPGISGSYILLLLGKYQQVLSAVNQRDFLTLGLITVGAVIGLITFAQILHYLFKRYHNATVAVLIGLMIGSLRKIWPWKLDTAWLTDAAGAFILDSHGAQIVTAQQNIWPDFSTRAGVSEVLIALVLGLIGAALVIAIERVASRAERNQTAGEAEATI
jgi:putative membrane protein